MKPLWKVQEKAIKYTINNPNTMLNMEMGTGKTRVVIEVMRKTKPQWVLIVTPKSVVPVWRKEINKYHGGHPFYILELGSGTINSRAKKLSEFLQSKGEGTQIVVINYDVVWRDTIYRYLIRGRWDMVILDESHRAKSHKSKASKACYRLGRDAGRRICMSGTPMSNSPLDIFGQYRFLDDTVFGKWWTPFIDQYAIRGGPERRFIVGTRNLETLGRKFNSLAYTCTKEDIKDESNLVDIENFEYRYGELSPSARRIYKELRKDFVSEYNKGLIAVDNVLVQMLRFQQLTSGFTETTDIAGKNRVIQQLDNNKGNMLSDLMNDIPSTEPVVVFYKFKKDVEVIRELTGLNRLVYELSGSRNELEEWNQSSNGLIAVQYQAGSVGIDLTHANYVIFYSHTFSLGEYQQAQARVHRVGQKKPVTMVHLIMKDTIDEQIVTALENKQNVIDRVLESGLV